jgi:hypothetical protein
MLGNKKVHSYSHFRQSQSDIETFHFPVCGKNKLVAELRVQAERAVAKKEGVEFFLYTKSLDCKTLRPYKKHAQCTCMED